VHRQHSKEVTVQIPPTRCFCAAMSFLLSALVLWVMLTHKGTVS
jgi:hypothetical protein